MDKVIDGVGLFLVGAMLGALTFLPLVVFAWELFGG